ncbi:MAG: potC [Verrucomicrobiaceae bacterium]|nr:potC [Verrucomicrobiaceae bacterium]
MSTQHTHRHRFSTFCLVAVLVFLYAPLLVLMANSFNASKYGGQWEGFSWVWYERLFKDQATIQALLNTLQIGACATIGATLMGTMAAWCLHRYRSPLQRVHLVLTELPLAVPDIWIGVAMQLFFVSVGWELGYSSVIAAHITFCLCYVTALMLGRLQSFDFQIIDAARDLGASNWQVAWRVVLPVLWPGIVASGLLAFILSLDDFVITFFVSGPGAATLPSRVFAMAKTSRSLPVINALSTLLICGTFLIALVGHRLLKKTTVL